MSTKTFESSRPTGTLLRVEPIEIFNEAHLTIVLSSREEDICIAPSDAPALALAVLEAAGFDADMAGEGDANDHFSLAVHHLTRGLEEQARATAEAREQAKLEAEALVFLRIAQDHNNVPLTESWEGFLDAGTKLLYVKMAQKARELAQEGK